VDVDVLIAVVGVLVTILVGAAMILATRYGTEPASRASEDREPVQ
jgi:hypothetical protein